MYFSFPSYVKTLIFLVIIVTLPQVVITSQSKTRNVIITPLRWSNNSNSIAVTLSRSVEIHSTQNRQLLYALKGHMADVTSVSWSPNDATIATASLDQTVKLWNATDGRLLRTLTGHNDDVSFVGWTPDGKYPVSAAIESSPNLFIWDIQTGETMARYSIGTVRDGAFSPDGHKFAFVIGGNLVIYNSENFDRIAGYREAMCCSNAMWSMQWSPDGTLIVTGSGNGLVTVWNTADATVKTQFMINEYASHDALKVDAALAWVRDVRFNDDGTTVSAIAGDGTLKEWDVKTGAVVQQMKLSPLATASWSPFGGRLAVLDASFLPALDGTPSQKVSADKGFQIIVPNPTLGRLNTWAAICVKHGDGSNPAVQALLSKAVTQSTLTAFDSQIKALPVGSIPAACQADLLAMSAALQTP
ncbi:MAG: hypothetical protein ABI947_25640 [Chloroflexota bacterium]